MNRRRWLRMMGTAALGAPLLPLVSRLGTARAEVGAAPVRLILFPSLNGAQHFYPDGDAANMSVVTEPLRAFQSQLQFVRGVGIHGSENHFAIRAMFTGAPISDYGSPDPTVASIDQVVAAHVAGTDPTALRSLHLAAIPADAIEFYQLYGRSTFFFAPSAVDYEANPVAAYDRWLAGLGGGAPVPTSEPTTSDPSDAHHDAALGIVAAELDALGGRVAGLDRERAKIDAHREAVAGLYRGSTGGVTPPPPPTSCGGGQLASVENLRSALEGNDRAAYEHAHYSAIIDAQIDILARAVACGLTRVATLQCGSADGNVTVPIEGGLPHHNTSHGDQLQFARLQAWYAQKFARLLAALDVTDPLCPNGHTVLHNSVVVWMSECMPSSHGSAEVPCLYAGSAGGRLVTGGITHATGATNRHLMRTLGQTFGAPTSSMGHFGDTPISELWA